MEQARQVQPVQLLVATNVPRVRKVEHSHLLARVMHALLVSTKIKMDMLTAAASIVLLGITLEQHRPAATTVRQVCTRLPTHSVEQSVSIALLDLRSILNRQLVLNVAMESTKHKMMRTTLVVLVGQHVEKDKKVQHHLLLLIANAQIVIKVNIRPQTLSVTQVVAFVRLDFPLCPVRKHVLRAQRERFKHRAMQHRWRVRPGENVLLVHMVHHQQHKQIVPALHVQVVSINRQTVMLAQVVRSVLQALNSIQSLPTAKNAAQPNTKHKTMYKV